MRQTNEQRLIDRGRKAGLGTRELYTALTSRQPESSDRSGQSDSNGFVSDYDHGHRVFRPSDLVRRV